MSNLTTEQIIDWLANHLSPLGMAELLEAVVDAGERAVNIVEANPTALPLSDELIFDEFFYGLRDRLGISTWETIVTADESGVSEWVAQRTDDGPIARAETEELALIVLLRLEAKK